MPYLIALYCIVTAVTAIFALLKMKLMLTLFVIGAAFLALAVGNDWRMLLKQSNLLRKLIHAVTSVLMLFLALWLGRHFSIYLYYTSAPGIPWVLLGVLIGFISDQPVLERRKRRRP